MRVRVAGLTRPGPAVFLRAEWRKLIMVQYAVLPEVLGLSLPRGVELDLFEGRCLVSLVGFMFERVRVKGVAIPFHTRFEEVNLRCYVRRLDLDGVRRGVVFLREFVPRAAITVIARGLYEEPYATLPTRHRIAVTSGALEVGYEWKHRNTWHAMAVEASPTPQPILEGSVEEFITEHYWGFTKRTRGATSQYQVEHPRWETYPVLRHRIRVDFGALYGAAFGSLNKEAPHSVLLAEGSRIAVRSGTRLA